MRVEPNMLNECAAPAGGTGCRTRCAGQRDRGQPRSGNRADRLYLGRSAGQCCARGEACVLVRRETSPEDIRGMHAAVAVLTETGWYDQPRGRDRAGIGLALHRGAHPACGFVCGGSSWSPKTAGF